LKNRQYLIIFLFVFMTLGLSAYSYLGNFDNLDMNPAPVVPVTDTGDESYFKIVDYYLVDQGKPFLQLESTELTLSKANTVVVSFNPNGVIYRRNSLGQEEDPIFFSSKSSRAFTEKKEMYLTDTVEVKINNSNMKAEKVSIFNNGKQIEAQENVRTQTFDPKTNDQIMINSDFALYRPREEFFEYKSNVKGQVQRKRKYEEGVSFTTNLMTLSAQQSLVEMKGEVTFKKGNLAASSNQGTLYLENYNKKLKYYSLSDDVRLEENLVMGGKPIVRKAFSEKLEGLISEKKVILTGLPKVFQGRDVIKGNRIIIRENIETVEVDDANTNITLEREKEQI
jgi:lipopolysaccharide export system protein LptA